MEQFNGVPAADQQLRDGAPVLPQIVRAGQRATAGGFLFQISL